MPQSCGGGRFVRDARGVWRYGESGQPVSGAQDMTLSNFFNFPKTPDGKLVLVPRGYALENQSLDFCLDYDSGSGSTIVVPVEAWQKNDRVVGVWAPELQQEGGIRGMKFDGAESGPRPAVWEAPVAPTKPHDIRNMAPSLRRDLRRKGWAPQVLDGFTAYWERYKPKETGPSFLPDAD
jgi:hypothetical protein